jgi:BirA family biotin operon repressor/biotin-[acetyl-CoA-carboxylase] ligase
MFRLINKREIISGLETKIIGKKILLFGETDSTNSQAIRLAENGEKEGTVVIAEAQSSGRGRRGRPWFSPWGAGIYLSMILRPKIPPRDAFAVILLFTIAAVEAIRNETSLEARIKWPNDILIGGKKAGGTLIEIRTRKKKIDYLVGGIGINVNTDSSAFPEEMAAKTTSLKEITRRNVDRNRLIRQLLKSFEQEYLQFLEKGKESVIRKWLAHTDIIGKEVTIDMTDRSVEGQVMGIDENGSLLLKAKDKTEKIAAGDIHVVENALLENPCR